MSERSKWLRRSQERRSLGDRTGDFVTLSFMNFILNLNRVSDVTTLHIVACLFLAS